MKHLKLCLFLMLTLATITATASEFRLPGGGSIKYKQSLRILFKPINVPPYTDVEVTCTITSDGKSGESTTMIQAKDIHGAIGSWGFIDGKRLNGGIGEVQTSRPSTFSSAFKVIKETDYVEFINLDKIDTITIVPDSCVAQPWYVGSASPVR